MARIMTKPDKPLLTRDQVARRLARDLEADWVVNIGIGMPTMAVQYVPPERDVILHSENGIIGMGPPPEREEDIDRDLMSAGKGPVTLIPGGAYVHHADSFSLARGGRLVAGGGRHERGGSFFEPTVIAEAAADMAVAREETFGPLAPLFRFETEEEAVAAANDTEYGLAAYLFARDNARIWRVSEALEFGIVGVNAGITSYEGAPFGGVKASGLGREGSHLGIDEFLETKYVCIGEIR